MLLGILCSVWVVAVFVLFQKVIGNKLKIDLIKKMLYRILGRNRALRFN